MKRYFPIPLTLLLALGIFAAGALPALAVSGDSDRALGSNGEIFQAVTGVYGELFGPSKRPDSPVLALEINRPDGSQERLLVPGTHDELGDLESSASLVYDDASGGLFLVWESRRNAIHRLLNLVAFDGEEWTEPIQIVSNSFAIKGPIQLAITRDSYKVPGSEPHSWQGVSRAVLHLLWWEAQAGGDAILYAPFVLTGGSYEEVEPVVFRLADFDRAEPSGIVPSESLVRTPTLQPGRDHRTVVIGFANPETGRFSALETTVLPGELSHIADGVRASITEFSSTFNPGAPVPFAEAVRASIVEWDSQLNPRHVTSLADEVYRSILATLDELGGGDMQLIAERVRASITEFSVGLFGGEDLRLYDDPDFSVHELQSRRILPSGEEEASTHHLVFHTISSREAPALKREVTAVFLSDSGRDAIVVWEGAGWLRYLETSGEGWSEPRTLLLTQSLDLEQAYKVLAERARNR